MATQGHTFSKEERICSKKDIASLLGRGRWSSSDVLKVCAAPNELGFSRVLISVPKRYFKRAVKRNLLKRRIREAYRLQKDLLAGRLSSPVANTSPVSSSEGERLACGVRQPATRGYDILIQYNAAEVVDFATIYDDVAAVLRRLAQ